MVNTKNLFSYLPRLKLQPRVGWKETFVCVSLAYPSQGESWRHSINYWNGLPRLDQEEASGAEMHGKVGLFCTKKNHNFIYYSLNSWQALCKPVSLFTRGLWWQAMWVIHSRPQPEKSLLFNWLWLVSSFHPLVNSGLAIGAYGQLSWIFPSLRLWSHKWIIWCSKKETFRVTWVKEHFTQDWNSSSDFFANQLWNFRYIIYPRPQFPYL